MNYHEMMSRMVQKCANRTTIGWFDHSPSSYDVRVAHARAWRISERLQGRRVTLAQAIREN